MKTLRNSKYILISIIALTCVYAGASELMDPNVPGVAKKPSVYMPFENSNNLYGPNSQNPAYINQVNGDMAAVVYRSNAIQTLYPLISGPSYGVKGTYFDGISQNGGDQYCHVLTFTNAASETILSEKSLMSHTITFWIRSKDEQTQAAKYANNYIMRGPVTFLWGVDGKLTCHWWPNLSWKGTAAGAYNSYGQWIFVGVTINQSGVKFYKGAVGETPVLVADIPGDVQPTGLSLSTVAHLSIGFNSYVSAKYPNFDIDELRMWNNQVDESSALSLEDITAIWAYDYDPSSFCGDTAHPVPVGDFNGDCIVDLSDFKVLADNWYIDNRPVIE